MRLASEWRKIVRRAWSFRLIAIAVVLSGAEVVVPYYADSFPRGTFAVLSFLVTAGALLARIVAQKDMD